MAGHASRENGKKGGRPKGAKSARTLARERGRAKGLKQAEITAERTILEIARIGFTDRRGIWKDGRIKPLDEWTADEAALLEGLEVVIKNAEAGDGHTDTVHKIHLSKKIAALEVLAKHFGLLVEKLQISGEVTLADKIARARARVQAAKPVS